jgi:DNA-binding CsgD family transcriptional regulator
MTMKQIAYELGLSPKTVEHYLETVKLKLKCHTRQELIEKALAIGLWR